MSRARPTAVAHGTWRSGALHVWGWDGSSSASAAWLYSGFGHNRWSGAANGWHDSPVSYGELSRVSIRPPSGPHLMAPCVRLDPFGAAVWLSDPPHGDELSPSLAWFARICRLATRLVASGHVSPLIVDDGHGQLARWAPIPSDELTRTIDELHASMPAVCGGGEPVDAAAVLHELVDGIARSQLHHQGWRPDLGRQRQPQVQALRAAFTALATREPAVRGGTLEYQLALADLAGVLRRHQRRLAGEPVVRPRVRLTLPADPLDPWRVDLELVDDVDPSRWCTASDVWNQAPSAVELAGGVDRVAALCRTIAELVTELASTTHGLGGLGLGELERSEQPDGAELDVELAERFLDTAPHELGRAGIELIGPEHLVTATPSVRGRATPAPADDRRARFDRDALIEWNAVVDDAPLSDTDLERITSAGSTLLHTGHRWVRIDPAGLRRARRLLEEHRRDHAVVGPLELLRLAGESELVAPSEAAHAERGVGAATDPNWVADLLAGLPDDHLAEDIEPPAFVGELRHYQRRGLGWMRFLARLGLGGCLADDMGLGKTATTLAHLVDRPGPHLVVCPLSVVHNWEAEARRFTPSLRVEVHHGAGRRRDPSKGERAESVENVVPLFREEPADVVITTYGLIARDEALCEADWSTVVLDEAQMVKNPNTKTARAVRNLRARQKLALTGTPVENRLVELWSILDAVNPGLLGSQQRFRERFGMPIEKHGDPDVAAQLRRITQPFVLRRTKADKRLLPDLPDKIEQLAFATLTREQSVLYQQVVDQLLADAEHLEGMQRRGRVLAALTRLKQICNHPAHALRDGSRLAGRSGKLARFDELVGELLDIDERALVFTQFREMGELLQLHLHERLGMAAPFLHGGVGRSRRHEMVESFQDGTAPPILLISLKAGGTGLNLTAASQVIHYDRWWNPAVEDQATDRAWRIGQGRTVNVHKLVCQGTVEERIGQVIDEKRALADAVVGTGEAWLSELNTDQLRELVMLEHAAPSIADRHRSDP